MLFLIARWRWQVLINVFTMMEYFEGYYLKSSQGDKKDRLTRHTLQSYFGGRQLKDYKILSELGIGLSVIDNKNEIPTVGSLVNHKQENASKKVPRIPLIWRW